MIMVISEKKIQAMVQREVHRTLEDENIRRSIAMEYLVSLKKRDLTKFLEAVELRRQSDEKLAKLDEAEPDVDKLEQDIAFEQS